MPAGPSPSAPAAAGRWGMAVVRGRSMRPTLDPGDRLLVSYRRAPQPGDVVVVRLPDGVVAVKRLLHREPDGGWWVERDNPREGVDSWSVGAVAAGDLLAVGLVRLWPRPRRL